MTAPARVLLGLVGSGITASLTPPMHEHEADCQGMRCLYVPIDLDRLHLPGDYLEQMIRYARLLGFRGLNVTHPCKQAVVEHLDELAPDAAAIGAVNTIVFEAGRAVGYNTDVLGFERSFRRGLAGAETRKVVLLGAGGAGSAVAHALLAAGTAQLVIVDPDGTRLRRLQASLAGRFDHGRFRTTDSAAVGSDLLDADGLVNATPAGMAGHPAMPIDGSHLRPALWVADVVYLPLETELLRTAREIGCRTLDGGGMAVLQAAAAFELFTRRAPDVDRMFRHFEELVRRGVPAGPRLDEDSPGV